VASAEAFGGGSTEARGEGASGESENRPRPAAFSWVRSLRNLSRHFLDFAWGTPSHGIRQRARPSGPRRRRGALSRVWPTTERRRARSSMARAVDLDLDQSEGRSKRESHARPESNHRGMKVFFLPWYTCSVLNISLLLGQSDEAVGTTLNLSCELSIHR